MRFNVSPYNYPAYRQALNLKWYRAGRRNTHSASIFPPILFGGKICKKMIIAKK